ncbi:MAG TPA: AfsR/SARP family transcriptional regulator [Actinophytocola sp.]|jgi:DNA-binding SARP family transcriptional activator|uniref:AfsR/SARP family transcriptional regulator n=1 Tax=Actinophytocola sp. TaxID=1872138 RepID=UPI002F93F59A
MRLHILGPLEVQDDRGAPVEITGVKRRALLATLVVRAGRTVSAGRLITELWGEHPPANAANALQAQMRRLRRSIEAACGEPDRIVTRPPGYALTLRAGECDATRFAEQAAAARTIAAGEPARAIPLLRTALALWRGPALEGCALGDVCAAEAAALDEHRLTALETLFAASLRAGRHHEVIGELETTSAAYPLRERFHDQLMVALDRSGRRSDALAVYDRARRRLLADLGVEPGPALRARMRSIMTNEPGPVAADDVAHESAELSRELAELQRRMDTLASRQEALLASLRLPAPRN